MMCATLSVKAQETTQSNTIDSIKEARIDEAALLYPQIRQFTITHQMGMPANINAKFRGEGLFKGKLQSARTNINLNIPLLELKNSGVVGSIGVIHQFYGLTDVVNQRPGYVVNDSNSYIPMLSLGMTYSRRDTIFGRSVNFTASVKALVDPAFNRRQFSFTGLITVPLIQKQYTRLSLGAVISIDPSSPVPGFLFVNYFHKFKALDLDLMADLPFRIALRKPLKKASITAFGELGGSNSFFEFNANNSFPQDLTFSTFEIKSGLLFEYRMTKKVVFSLSGGALTTATSRIIEKGEKPKNYLINNKVGTVPFAQVGISILPFWRPFKK